MRMLLLSGTGWVGGLVASLAAARGHQVTCLSRGLAGPPAAPIRFVRADRDAADAYRDVVDQSWDVVVDVARSPDQVRDAVAALAGSARHAIYVSSVSVYAENGTPGADESATLLPALSGDWDGGGETYGQAKVACEQHVLAGFGPGRCLLVRPGLIAGPGDVTDRTGYWPLRFARPAGTDGTVLVPAAPDLLVQQLDVRDLAGWLVDAAERAVAGTMNAVGETLPLSDVLQVAREVVGHRGELAAAGQDWLLAHGVRPWAGPRSLPLWVPLPQYRGHGSRDGSAARAAGLVLRPIEQTLADTLRWELDTAGPDRERQAGLTDADERELISALRAT